MRASSLRARLIRPVVGAAMLLIAVPAVSALALDAGTDPGGEPSTGLGIDPMFITGNPTCSGPGSPAGISLGYANGFKPQNPPPGSGDFNSGELTVNFPGDPDNQLDLEIVGKFLDWESTLGIDAVIVKGGPNADAFVYQTNLGEGTEAFADTGLHAPVDAKNPNTTTDDDYFDISHVEFCYDYEVEVEKTADTSYTRTWTWTIEKSADQTDLLLAEGQQLTVNYEVTVDATFLDSDFAVSGDIDITNPDPNNDATIVSVDDVLTPGDMAATVDCGIDVTFPHTLASGETLECTYSKSVADTSVELNTATVTTSGAVGGGSDTADVIWGDPTDLVDECIEVSDTNDTGGVLPDTVCATVDDLPVTFKYSLDFGANPNADVVLECGENSHPNTASFVTTNDDNDTGATGESTWTVDAEVACEDGCTLTQGYWKTHSHNGPAPEDDAWFALGDVDNDGTSEGADEPFFLSGKTYYQVLWTPPAGNVYYVLAHQYIAAQLNILNGADVPVGVQTAFDSATALFETYTPAQVAAAKGPTGNTLRSMFTSAAMILDDYNNGLTGPGHCTE
jgi:hypothetical protein